MTPDDPLIGLTINDQYLIKKQLGSGGMGCVYQADNLRLDGRPCAIKVLKDNQTDPMYGEVRFKEELKIISQLRSPHIVQVLDKGELTDGRLYIVMELLEGEPLSAILERDHSLPIKRTIPIIQGILAGLSEAHEFGIIHRDLKPANIFITRSVVGYEIAKVLDFGIAKNTQEYSSVLTHTQQILGTPQYMSPEQLQKEQLDQRTDLYAVGLLLYELLSGEPPYQSNSSLIPDSLRSMPSEVKVMWLHMNAKPAPLAVPPLLWKLCESLLEKAPQDRPKNATEVISQLAKIIELIETIEYTKKFNTHKRLLENTHAEPLMNPSVDALLPEYDLSTINELNGPDESTVSELNAASLPLTEQARLIITQGPQQGLEYLLDRRELTLGRNAEQSDLIIQHPTISSAHVSLVKRDHQFVITDLGSSNGLRVNGTKTMTVALSGGDLIMIGEVELLYLTFGDSQPYVSPIDQSDTSNHASGPLDSASLRLRASDPDLVAQSTGSGLEFGVYTTPKDQGGARNQWLKKVGVGALIIASLLVGFKVLHDLTDDEVTEITQLKSSGAQKTKVRVLRPRSQVGSKSALMNKRAGRSRPLSRLVLTDQGRRQSGTQTTGKTATHASSPKDHSRAQDAQLKRVDTQLRSDQRGATQPPILKTPSGAETKGRSDASTDHQSRPPQGKPPKKSSPPKARYVSLELITKGLFFPPGARVRLRPIVRPRSLRKHLRYVIKPRRAGYMRGNTLWISRAINVDQVKVRACVHSVCSRHLKIRLASADAPE